MKRDHILFLKSKFIIKGGAGIDRTNDSIVKKKKKGHGVGSV